MILTIAYREFSAMFRSPLAWVILAVIQLILGFMFLSQLENFAILQPQLLRYENTPGVTDIVISPLMEMAAIVLLMVMPLITMRSLAEEKRNRTLTLLLSAPLRLSDIVMGKFVGIFGFIVILLGLLLLMPLSLYLGTSLDTGKLFSIWIAMTLLLASFAAIGIYLSSLTDNQTIAAVTTFGALLLLWIIEWGAGSGDDTTGNLLGYLSLLRHHQAMMAGVFDSSDIAYYLILMSGFLGLTIRQLDRERLL